MTLSSRGPNSVKSRIFAMPRSNETALASLDGISEGTVGVGDVDHG